MEQRPKLELTGSPPFTARLAQAREPGLHQLPGRQTLPDRVKPDGRLSILRAHVFAVHGPWDRTRRHALDVLAVSALALRELLDPGATTDGYDAVYVPVAGHTTGDIDVHDIHAGNGRPVFVATRFKCPATIAECASFASWCGRRQVEPPRRIVVDRVMPACYDQSIHDE